MRYAKEISEGKFRYYSGDGAIPTDNGFIVRPEHEQLVENHYYPVQDDWVPSEPAPEGKEWVKTGKIVFTKEVPIEDSYYHPEYVLRVIPPPIPRRFSKLKAVSALIQRGVWSQVKNYIETNGLYDLYLAAQVFSEDNQYFRDGLAELKTQLGWTDEQVEDILSECIAEL